MIKINNSRSIETNKSHNDVNLCLYLPGSYSFPPKISFSLVNGLLLKYWNQNTIWVNYQEIMGKIFQRLQGQGWPERRLREVFSKVTDKTDKITFIATTTRQDNGKSDSGQLAFLHIQFLPQVLRRGLIRKVREENCNTKNKNCDRFSNLRTDNCSTLNIYQLTVAYLWPKTLCNTLTASKIHQASGREVSKTLDRGSKLSNL